MKRFVGFAVAGMAAASCMAADWPQWRGPDRNGISKETGWLAPGAAAKQVWKAEVGAGYSSVSVSDGKLYTMGNKDGQDSVLCLNATDGKELWRHSYPCKAGSYSGPRCTPTVENGKVYTLSREGLLLCFAAQDGAVKWERNLAATLHASAPNWGFAGSPLVQGDLVIVNVGDSGTALNKETGEPVWNSSGGGASYATPVPFAKADKPAVALFVQKAVVGVEAASGKKLWEYPWSTSYDVNAPDPIVIGDKVFITSGYGRGAALLDVSGAQPKVEWENKNLASHFSSVVLFKDCLYGITGNAGGGELRCVELASGKVNWSNKETGFGSLIMADGKLIVLNEKGTLFVFELNPDGCGELWKGTVLGPTCWTPPVLCNGLIYCRNEKGTLVAVDLRGK